MPNATASASSTPAHLPQLDGVRGCAILLVVCSHVVQNVLPATTVDRVVIATWRAGWIGVDLFFALSGFLITGILIDSRSDPHYFRTFFARRVLRILPAYLVVLALVTIAAAAIRPAPAWDAWLATLPWHLTYLTNVFVATQGWNAAALQSGHLWSLAVEEQFYLTWPFVVLLAGADRLRRGVARALLYVPVARGLALAAGLVSVAVHALTPFRVDSLLAGALLAAAIRGGDERTLRAMRRIGPLALVALLVLCAGPRGLPYTSPWVQTIGYSALALASAALIAHLLDAREDSVARRVFGSRVLRSFGRYSYAIYLFHAPLLLVTDHLAWNRSDLPLLFGSRTPALVVYGVAFSAAMWLLGAVSWWAVERHFLALKRRFPYATAGVDAGVAATRSRAA